jgi:hypothetical protein
MMEKHMYLFKDNVPKNEILAEAHEYMFLSTLAVLKYIGT